MRDFEKKLFIFKSIFTSMFFLMIAAIEPVFIYIAGASIMICGATAASFCCIDSMFYEKRKDRK